MTKTLYIQPQITLIKVDFEQHILTASERMYISNEQGAGFLSGKREENASNDIWSSMNGED